MHNNYYFIRQLSNQLIEELLGLELAVCFSQNRDELVLGFCNPDREFWMKANFQPDLCILIFPTDFHRARRNSIDLFQPIIGCKVIGVRQFENERVFSIELTNNLRLVFKLFGNRSNVVLFEGNEAVDLFRKRFTHDADQPYEKLDREIDQSKKAFTEFGLKKCFPTFGKVITAELEKHHFSQLNLDQQWEKLQELLDYLEQPSYYVSEVNGNKPQLTLFESEKIIVEADSPIEAGNAFFYHFSKIYFTKREKEKVLRWIQNKVKRSDNYIAKSSKRLQLLEHGSRFEEVANIIMANLHQIDQNAEEVELFDFYREENIKIKLNTRITPQKNAEKFYRKAKNQKLEVNQLKENIAKKEADQYKWMEHTEAIEALTTYKELINYQKKHGMKPEEADQAPTLPFKKFSFQGFDILVGKNSKSNDILTQKYAYKDDLWLHARDVTGSHVVIKYKPNHPFPPLVIEKAASLAAYYSQGKSNAHQPVIYTPKKFVRKPKNAVPGQVFIDKEEVIIVSPQAFDEEL